jgi:SAM-dependent methyltransferase
MDHLLELTSRAEANHFWFRGFRRFVAPVIDDVAGGRRDLKLLDCGCGTGHNLTFLRPYGNAFGFDLTEGGAARAHASGHAIARGDVTHIPFATGRFDVATSFDVMQCIEQDFEAVLEMGRVLRPGGVLVMTVAALEALRGDHSEAWQECRRYTPGGVRRLVESTGLRVERVSFLFASLFPLMLAVRGLQRTMRPFRQPRLDTDIGVPPAPVNGTLSAVVAIEASLSRRISMPVGSSLLVVARKSP